MKILYDNQIFGMQKFGGISNYFVNLINHLPKTFDFLLPMMLSENAYLNQLNKKVQTYRVQENFRGKRKFNKLFSAIALKLSKYDIFHPTYYDSYFLRYLPSNKPFVLTVHDMIHELYPQYFPQDNLEYSSKQLLCERADKIIAISYNTKKDLMDLFAIPDSKITVVHHATNFQSLENIEKANNLSWLPENYLLFIGSRDGYKNFWWMLEALAPILKQLSIKLLVIGVIFNEKELAQINKLNLQEYIIQNNVNSMLDLQEVYSRSKLFIFPSLYEGFGIPILEAFASGTAVLLANASCFPEIAGDAALYFNVSDMNDFRQQVLSVINSFDVRNELVYKGYKRLSMFSWYRTSETTAKVYKQLC